MKHKLNWMLWRLAYKHSTQITLADLASQLDVSRIYKLAQISIKQAEFTHPYRSLSEFNRSLIWLIDRVNASQPCTYFSGTPWRIPLYQWVIPTSPSRGSQEELQEFLRLCGLLSAIQSRPEIDRTTTASIKLAHSLGERTLLAIGDLIA